MFDLIKKNVVFDLGMINAVIMNNINSDIKTETSYPSGKWASKWASKEKSVNKAMKKFYDDIMSLPE